MIAVFRHRFHQVPQLSFGPPGHMRRTSDVENHLVEAARLCGGTSPSDCPGAPLGFARVLKLLNSS